MFLTEKFRAEMSENGLAGDFEIIVDGERHRFHVTGDRRGKKNAWYILFPSGSGAYGCWKRGFTKRWSSKSKETMTGSEWAEHQTQIKIAIEKHDDAKRNSQVAAREKAQRLYGRARPASNEFPYLKRKDVKSHGIRCVNYSGKDVLIIPIYGTGGMQSIQFIDQDGNKWFLSDGTVNCGYFPIGDKSKSCTDVIGIGEGFVTCAQVHEILGCRMACAFNCGNLIAVAQVIRKKYPQAEIIIFADNDQWPNKDGIINNRGLNKAREAANAIRATITYPNFTGFDTSTKPTDWNDLKHIAGIDEARHQLLASIQNNSPQRLPDPLSKVAAFDPKMLPESIRGYVIDVTERQQCPVDFVAVSSVCALGAILGRKAFAMPKQHDDWTVVPNLWGAIIGKPSTMKTPGMKAALEPLHSIDSTAATQHKSDMEEYRLNREFSEVNKASAKEEAKRFMKEKKPEEARNALKNASFDEEPPSRKRLVVNDTSIEKLGVLLNENPNGLILVRDELAGWLARLTREEFQSERAFYLECYNGKGSFVYDRIGRGTLDIQNLTLSVIGGIQPSKISPLIRDSVSGVNNDGLIQRLQMAVWPDDAGSWKWVDRAPNTEVYGSYVQAFKDLHELSFDQPLSLRFTPEAQSLFIVWMEEIQAIARADDTHPVLESHLLKMPETVASLALLFEILEGGTESIGLTATAMALEWADYLRSHAERLYSAATNPGLTGAHLILKRFDNLEDEFTARDVHRKEWTGLRQIREVEDALLYLVDYKHLTRCEVPSTGIGGRPTVIYIKNKKYTKKGY